MASAPPETTRHVYWAIGTLLPVGVLLWYVPLVRVVPLAGERESSMAGIFQADHFADQFWTESLEPSFSRAQDAEAAIVALVKDPRQARERFGRTMGVSRGFLLYLRGSGRILSVDPKGVSVTLDENDTADVVLNTGLVFGSAVRDATGLISPNDLANSQQFNGVSAELNRLVEQRVLPQLREQAVPGTQIEFIGCAMVRDPVRFARPLSAVPVSFSIK